MDAAYYPYQVNFLLDHGRLAYNDMPLFFWLAAIITRGLDVLGYSREVGALLASQVVDSFGQPLAAIGIGALLATWCYGRAGVQESSRRGRAAFIMLVAGLAAAGVLHHSPLRMVNDFEKNALALMWFVWAVWAALRVVRVVDRCIAGGSNIITAGFIRKIVVLCLFSGLTLLTHIGTFGVLLLTFCVGFVVWVLMYLRSHPRLVACAVGGACICAAVGWGVIYAFDSHRAMNLLKAPSKIMSSGGARGPGMPPDRNGPGNNGQMMRGPQPQRGFGGPGGPGGPGGGPGGGMFTYVVAGAGVLAIVILHRRIAKGERALAASLCASALVCAAPVWSGDYAMRLSLMAPFVAVLAAAGACGCVWVYAAGQNGGLLTTGRSKRLRAMCAAAGVSVGVVALAGAHNVIITSGHTIVTELQVEELKQMRRVVESSDPLKTLVVAQHGVEWWAGYILKVPVRLDQVPEDAFERYDRVYVLTLNRNVSNGEGVPGGGRRGGDSSRSQSDASLGIWFDPLDEPEGDVRPVRSAGDKEPQRPDGQMIGAQSGPRVSRGPLETRGPRVPDGAVPVYEGGAFVLYEVPNPRG